MSVYKYVDWIKEDSKWHWKAASSSVLQCQCNSCDLIFKRFIRQSCWCNMSHSFDHKPHAWNIHASGTLYSKVNLS